jgi:HEAT repeat protein
VNLRSNIIEPIEPGGSGNLSAAAALDPASEACRALGGVLREGVDIHRCEAAQALGRIDHPAGTRALVDALLDEDEDVRTDAAGALARLAPREAGRQLLENLLGDPCAGVKLAAIEALTRLRHPELAPWLRRLVAGRDPEIVWDEAEFYEGGWDDWVDIQLKAIQSLAELGVEDAVPEIVAAIDDELGQDLTAVGFKALGALGDPGVVALIRYLAEGDERQRRRVAVVLAACPGEAARNAVTQALGDPAKEVRRAAAQALATRDPGDPRLAALFSDPEPELRAEAVRLCGRAHPDRLAKLLDDGSTRVQGVLFDLLAARPELLPRDSVAPVVRAALAGPDGDLAAEAAVALAAVSPEDAADDLVAQLGDPARPVVARLGAIRALTRLGGVRATEAFADILIDDERELRLKAIAGLATLAAAEPVWPNGAGEILLAGLRGDLVPEPEAETELEPEPGPGPDPESEAEAETPFPTSTLAAMLGDRAPPPAEPGHDGPPLELTQEDLDHLALAARKMGKRVVPVLPPVAPHQDVRRFAARVLGDVAREKVALELAAALSQALGQEPGGGDLDLRRAAADSLARIGARVEAFPDPVIDALLQGLIDADRDIRLYAIRALGGAGGPGAARTVEAQLEDPDSFVRAEAVRALDRLDAAGPSVAVLLEDPDPGVRLAAAQAVARGADPMAGDLLGDFAFGFEGYHRRQAGRLLRRLDRTAANDRFLEALADPDSLRQRPIAIAVLEELNRTDEPSVAELTDRDTQEQGAGVS